MREVFKYMLPMETPMAGSPDIAAYERERQRILQKGGGSASTNQIVYKPSSPAEYEKYKAMLEADVLARKITKDQMRRMLVPDKEAFRQQEANRIRAQFEQRLRKGRAFEDIEGNRFGTFTPEGYETGSIEDDSDFQFVPKDYIKQNFSIASEVVGNELDRKASAVEIAEALAKYQKLMGNSPINPKRLKMILQLSNPEMDDEPEIALPEKRR